MPRSLCRNAVRPERILAFRASSLGNVSSRESAAVVTDVTSLDPYVLSVRYGFVSSVRGACVPRIFPVCAGELLSSFVEGHSVMPTGYRQESILPRSPLPWANRPPICGADLQGVREAQPRLYVRVGTACHPQHAKHSALSALPMNRCKTGLTQLIQMGLRYDFTLVIRSHELILTIRECVRNRWIIVKLSSLSGSDQFLVL